MTQEEALEILKTGANVFLTGEPGAGKSHTVNAYVRYVRSCGIEPAITASTGIAATHIGGMTIHAWSGIGIATRLTGKEAGMIAARTKIKKRLETARVLIIDEVSMLSAPTLAMVDMVCRAGRESGILFGGLQVVLVGDFFQLPPVSRDEKKAPFAYASDAWTALNPVVCYLSGQYRQDDPAYLDILAAIRANRFGAAHRDLLLGQKRDIAAVPADIPKLFSHNADVDRINKERLHILPGSPSTFQMESFGSRILVDMLKRNCLSPEVLVLKKGATVMCTKNHPQGNFVNGTLGTIYAFDRDTGYPMVEKRAGGRITIKPMEWTIGENGRTRARVAQVPLRLAWAMTVHKSQGMSMDAAVVDLSDAFEYGQGYVALSRVRRLSGLYLLGANDRAFMVSDDILEKDRRFRLLSEKAEEKLRGMAPKDIATKHATFVWRCGGKMPEAGDPAGETKNLAPQHPRNGINGYMGLRERYPNAYRPWSNTDDDRLRELFNEGHKTAAMATRFGRQPGAVRSRLLKLGLVAYNTDTGKYESKTFSHS